MPGQHLKGKICGQVIRRDMVDEIITCSESKFMIRANRDVIVYLYMIKIYSQPIKSSQQKFMLYLS